MLADVEQLAREQPPLDPPFVDIVQAARSCGALSINCAASANLVVAAQPLDLG